MAGLGGKLLRAQLGRGLAQGPLAAQDNQLKLLQARLAQQFDLEKADRVGFNQRQNTNLTADRRDASNELTSRRNRADSIFGQNLQASVTPGEIKGLSDDALRRNQLTQTGQERTNTLQSLDINRQRSALRVDLAVEDARIQRAWSDAGLGELNLERLRIGNKMTSLQAQELEATIELRITAARMSSQMDLQNFAHNELRNKMARVDLDIRTLEAEGVPNELALKQIQLNSSELEYELLKISQGVKPGSVEYSRIFSMANTVRENFQAAQANWMSDFRIAVDSGAVGAAELVSVIEATDKEKLGYIEQFAKLSKKMKAGFLPWPLGDAAGISFEDLIGSLRAMSTTQVPGEETAQEEAALAADMLEDLYGAYMLGKKVNLRSVEQANMFLSQNHFEGGGVDPASIMQWLQANPDDPFAQSMLNTGGVPGAQE